MKMNPTQAPNSIKNDKGIPRSLVGILKTNMKGLINRNPKIAVMSRIFWFFLDDGMCKLHLFAWAGSKIIHHRGDIRFAKRNSRK